MPVAAQIGGGGSTRTHGGLRNPGINGQLWRLILRYSRPLRLDPYAVAAVSRVEGGGRFGAVGDAGTSYGPFQLHVGGALPQGRDAAWANSPAGVRYAMQHMAASGAAGLRGLPAVRAIVYRFERPARPGPEVTNAWGGYRSFGGPLPANTATGGNEAAVLRQIMAQQQQQMALFGRAQTAMFARSQRDMLRQMQTQAAQQRQQSLAQNAAQQLLAQHQAGQQAQAQLSVSGGATGEGPTTLLGQQRKTALEDLHAQALRQIGVGV